MRLSSHFLRAFSLFLFQLFFIISAALAQNNPVAVSGKVVDEKNIPLQGVSVQVKGGKIIAITNRDGSFSATAPKDAILQFTYQGIWTIRTGR
jgi:TonB-dependent starch-binding outer membrane protein SusC